MSFHYELYHYALGVHLKSEPTDDFITCSSEHEEKQRETCGFNFRQGHVTTYFKDGLRFGKSDQLKLYARTKDDIRWKDFLKPTGLSQGELYRNCMKKLRPYRLTFKSYKDFTEHLSISVILDNKLLPPNSGILISPKHFQLFKAYLQYKLPERCMKSINESSHTCSHHIPLRNPVEEGSVSLFCNAFANNIKVDNWKWLSK